METERIVAIVFVSCLFVINLIIYVIQYMTTMGKNKADKEEFMKYPIQNNCKKRERNNRSQ